MRLTLTFVLAFFIVLTVSCDRSGSGRDDDEKRQSVRRGNSAEPGTLDPGIAENLHTFNVLIDMYEGLLAEAADGSLLPGVAESWEISADGLVYTFAVRADARWSNGDSVTADDFVRAFRRNAVPETLSTYASLLEPIQNFRAVNDGEMPATELGVIAHSASELEIRLSKPAGHFLSVLSLPIAFPRHASGKAHVSNGAFIFFDQQLGGALRLRKNSRYWDADSVRIDEVIYLPIADEMAEFNMYRAGDLDITMTIPGKMVKAAIADYGAETRIAPTLALYYLAFDLHEAPFDNDLLRQALTMAVDREQLASLIGRGESPAFGIVPPGVDGYEAASFDWMNLEKGAREKLARDAYSRAGYSAEHALRITYLYDTDGIHEQVALAVTGMWNQVLGVETELEKREWKYFLQSRDRRVDWDIMRFAWAGDYNAASTFLDVFRTDSPQNLPQYQNAEYDKELNLAARQVDPESAARHAHDAEAMLLSDYPIVPLYFYVSKHMVKPTVLGFEDSVVDRHPSRYFSISSRQ